MLSIKLSEVKKPKIGEDSLGFGRYFTDHMFKMDYSADCGWHNPRIEPYSPFVLDPSVMTFHYGQAIFEGLKAFRGGDGRVRLFRPRDNFVRMNRSCERMCIPKFEEHIDTVMQGLEQLLDIEQDWVPCSEGTSLYIRPTIIALDTHLGVRASNTYLFYIILSPVAAYYSGGFAPVSLYVEDFYTRSMPGGTGEAKCSGNYAASIIAGEKAKKLGFDQVLWLDGKNKEYVEEVGSMNIFFRIDDEVITPALDGTILAGITRDSVIKILQSFDIKVSERQISIKEVIKAAKSGRLKEAFGTGTAAVVSPVGSLTYAKETFLVGDGGCGKLTMRLYDTLTGIQKGRIEDKFGWIVSL